MMIRQSLTIAEIRSKLPEWKKRSDKEKPWLHFVMRPISVYPTWLLLRLGISANQITFIGLVIGVVGCVFLAFGSYWAGIVGAILVNIMFLFDVLDGNVARCTNSSSKYGHYLDAVSGYVIAALMPIAVGIGIYRHPDPYLTFLTSFLFGAEIANHIYLILGVLCSFLWIFRFLITNELGLVFSTKPEDFYKPKTGSEKDVWGIIYTLGVAIEGMVKPVLLIFAITHHLGIFLLLWTLVAVADFITATTRALLIARKIE